MSIEKEYYRYSHKRIDMKENRFYNIIYVIDCDVTKAKTLLARAVSKVEKDLTDNTIYGKILKGTNADVVKILDENKNKVIGYREVFKDGVWSKDIIGVLDANKK